MEELLQAFGYKQVESNNAHMWSYKNKDTGYRLNYYFNTGTLTIQTPPDSEHKYGKMIVNEKNIKTLDEIDKILQKTA